MRGIVLLAVLLLSCATVHGQGGRTLRADVTTGDGATLSLQRWSNGAGARRVLVVPPLGFDAALVGPLCQALRERGFDVASFSWRPPRAGAARGLAAAARDVEAAYAATTPELVLLVGYGGVAALPVLRRHPPRGVLAVNVPVRLRLGNPALRAAWGRDGYAPRDWARGREAALLLGAGRVTPPAVAQRLLTLAVPVDATTARELTTLALAETTFALPAAPVRFLVGAKDNLVHGEDALVPQPDVRPPARRMAVADYFARDWGHLDWLVDPLAEADVWPVIADELEALP